MENKLSYKNGCLYTDYDNCYEIEETVRQALEDAINGDITNYITLYFCSEKYEYYIHTQYYHEIKPDEIIEVIPCSDNVAVNKLVNLYWKDGDRMWETYKLVRDGDIDTIILAILSQMDSFNEWVERDE